MKNLFLIFFLSIVLFACKSEPKIDKKNLLNDFNKTKNITTYADHVSFMKDYIDIIELSNNNVAKVAVSAQLQGRVMTSSSSGLKGSSYGWINRELFKSKDTLDHINVFGGEERFWLGPEGGQYSLFFKKGSQFILDDWYTPKLIDLEPFGIKTKTTSVVTFTKTASLVNYSGFKFDIDIEREIKILSTEEINTNLGIELPKGINAVAYKTTNSLTNSGKLNWEKDTGLLSIWLLGMFNPSPEMTIVIPFKKGSEAEFGTIVNDDYFGKVPADRLIVKEDVIYFKGDGNFRSKIGLSPKRAKNILGSYDGISKTLTIVKYNKPKGVSDYVNSKWGIQEKPYSGDVVNSYNDGIPAPGEKALGPFYELETSSPALHLKVDEKATHIQETFHFEGKPEALTKISEQLLGVSISDISNVFNDK